MLPQELYENSTSYIPSVVSVENKDDDTAAKVRRRGLLTLPMLLYEWLHSRRVDDLLSRSYTLMRRPLYSSNMDFRAS